MYSMIAGTGWRSASAGSHTRAASRAPSGIGIHMFSISRIAASPASTIFILFLPTEFLPLSESRPLQANDRLVEGRQEARTILARERLRTTGHFAHGAQVHHQ